MHTYTRTHVHTYTHTHTHTHTHRHTHTRTHQQGKSERSGSPKTGRPITYTNSSAHADRRKHYLKSTQIGFEPGLVGRPAKGCSRKQERRKELAKEKALYKTLGKRNLLTVEGMKTLQQSMRLPYIRKNCSKFEILKNSIENVGAIKELAQLHERTKKAVKSPVLNIKQKKALKEALTEGSTTAQARIITGDSRWTVWRLRRMPPARLTESETYCLFNQSVTETTGEENISTAVDGLYCGFFEKYTGVHSGADNDVRKMEIPKSTMGFLLYAELPAMYRQMSISNPALVEKLTSGSSSRLSKGIREANRRATETSFNADLEKAIRMEMAQERYNGQLLVQRLSRNRQIMPGKLPAKVKKNFTALDFEVEDTIFPVGDQTFYQILKRNNMKWRNNAKPTFCPVCTSGLSEAVLLETTIRDMATCKAEQKQLNASKDEAKDEAKEQLRCKLASLWAQQLQLTAKQKEYEAHVKQFAICRPYVNEVVTNLKPGECMMFRDFVNQYATDGTKIGNLQLVVLYRTKVDSLVRQLKVSNFNRKPTTDWFFVRDVMDFHLRGKDNGGSGLFDKFERIYISGDHGAHFSAKQNINFESTIFSLYMKVVILLFLCSYHCYNRCDAAGVYSKKLSIACAREKKVLVESKDYAMALMEDASCDTLGYDFKVINRSLLILDEELKDPPKDVILRKMCEFVFLGPGVFKCRRVPGEGKFIFLDLRPTAADSTAFFCIYCSGEKQEAIYHESNVCPKSVANRFIEEEDCVASNIDMNASPANDSSRKEMLKGKQLTKKMQKNAGAEQRVLAKPFGCKRCDVRRYKTPNGANKHMKSDHFMSSDDSLLYPVPSKAVKRKRVVIAKKQRLAKPDEPEQGVNNDTKAAMTADLDAGVEAQDSTQPDVPEEEVVNNEVAEQQSPLEPTQFNGACNTGVHHIVENSESKPDGPSASEGKSQEQEVVEQEFDVEQIPVQPTCNTGVQSIVENSEPKADGASEGSSKEQEVVHDKVAVKQVPMPRAQYNRACNTGVQSIVENSESESDSPSESEESSSAADSDEESDFA
jgi:hypothetical protein